MLLNNFKLLFQFYPDSKFINVLGEEVNKGNVLAGQVDSDRYNGHCNHASNLLYNYNPTMNSNNYTNEQTTYSWAGVAGGRVDSDLYGRYNGFVLFIGSGDTPPAPEDYKLENALELRVLTASCYHYENGRTIISREFFNNTDEDVTIKELGCYIFVNIRPNQPLVMIGRKVLPQPVLIPQGQQYTFTYTIDTSSISFEEADS